MTGKRLAWLQTGLIALGAWWAFSSSFNGTWLWDDDQYVTANFALRSWRGLWQLWTHPPGVNYFPVTDTVRWIQWHLWADAPLGYRLTNVASHFLGALLVWNLAVRLGLRFAWLAGLLFAVHPLAVESVAWVSELKNVLSLPPLLWAMSRVIDYERDERPGQLAAAFGWFVVAILCKSTVVFFPVVVLAYFLWRRRSLPAVAWRSALLLSGPALAFGLCTVWLESTRSIGNLGPVGESLWTRIDFAGLAVGFYLKQAFQPFVLMPIYPRWDAAAAGFMAWALWPLFITAAVILYRKGTPAARAALFAGFSFVCALAPVLGIIPMALLRLSWVADHFAYAALVPLIIAVVALGETILFRAGPTDGLRAWGFAAAGAALAGLLAVASHRYAQIFRSPETLWTYTAYRNPGAWTAHNDLGNIRMAEQATGSAIEEYKLALAAKPDYPEAESNLGIAYMRSQQIPVAIEHFDRALALRPAYPSALTNLGNAYLLSDNPQKAADCYRRALAIQPALAPAHENLAMAYDALGLPAQAELERRAAASLPEERIHD